MLATGLGREPTAEEIAELVLRHLKRACDEYGATADLTTIVQPLEKRVGVEVRAKKSS